ncbi:adenine-specific DNA-methyltransferase [Methylobacterium sp. OAE515]|uniref:site-specific DNA-methyltransferase n=1 Tax=Methylobacterium sp. OAE515 TaxID=2817895 RepID=UPI0017892556
MEKLKMHSPNLAQENIAKIRALFPGCVTEAQDEITGQLHLAVDFDQLRQELNDQIVEGPQERYRLDWPGKRQALATANAPVAKTLRPSREESVNFDGTQNLFIEGDNLLALKLLQETYLGQVKMIYIDPPYNTGNDFIYNDKFDMPSSDWLLSSNQIDDVGDRLVSNTESNGRFHSDWLGMIYARLKLVRNLLSDNGAIFISIGQEELSGLLQVCFEVFGEENFITICSRVMKTGGQKGTHFSPSVDYVLVFAKNIFELAPFREQISQNVIDKVYTSVEETGPRAGQKYRSMGLYQAMLDARANQRYFIEDPDGNLLIPPGSTFPSEGKEGAKVTPVDGDGVWRWTYDRFKQEKENGNISFVASDRTSLIHADGSKAKWNVYYKIWLDDRMRDGQLPGNILEKFQSRHSSAELKKIDIPFEFAKPTDLIKFFATLVCAENNDLVLDFFAGSGTTAHAIMAQSAETGQRLRCISVQLPEAISENDDAFKQGFKTVSEISKERIRRAGKKLLQEEAHPDWNKDVGFRVLKIDASNMQDVYYRPDQVDQKDLLHAVDNIKPDRTAEDLLFQVLVDWGVDLTLPIRCETVQGKDVFVVDENALIACFDTGVTEELVKELAGREPLRVVFRDNGFVSDAVKINVEQVFRQLSPGTDVKSI